MYNIVLSIHSFFRWLVLISLLYALYRSYTGWFTNSTFSKLDNFTRHTTATIAHIQLILGLSLYFISPLVSYFLHHYTEALHDREMRFFGMEHITMMLIAISIITIGSILAKRKQADKQKFKTMAVWYTIALLVILTSVPWPFSPIVSRPYFRMF
jgi:hypothetical protein